MARKQIDPYVSILNDIYGVHTLGDGQELTDAVRALVKDALLTLKDEDRRVLCMFYGLDEHRMNLTSIGKTFGVTYERARRWRMKALRKLKHPSRSRPIRTMLVSEGILEPSSPTVTKTSEEPQSFFLNCLSIRAYNVLRDAGVTSHEEVKAMSDDAILRLPNSGRKVLNEIREVLRMGDPYVVLLATFRFCSASALEDMGVRNLGQLCTMTEAEILSLPNVTEEMVCEIKEVLDAHGLCLGMKRP